MNGTCLVVAMLTAFALPAHAAETFSGRAQVAGGDTLIVEGQAGRVRLFGIDAPEAEQTCRNAYGLKYRCGSRSAEALAGIVGRDGVVTCEERNRDRRGEIVAVCRKGQEDIAAALVRAGWARDYERYSHGRYASLQAEAKSAGRGAWSGRWTAPWKWREEQRGSDGR